jgi:DNA-binding XRE family transcriptional regulator
MHATITKKGRKFFLVPETEYRTAFVRGLPSLPKPDAEGNVDAVAFGRATIARGIIRDREALGWSQAELARRAGINVETLNRIERAKVTPTTATIMRIDAALKATSSPRRK